MDNPIDLTSDGEDASRPIQLDIDDEEDEDLKLAIALSLQESDEQQSSKIEKQATKTVPKAIFNTANDSNFGIAKATVPISNGSSGIPGLDRKQMEAERLARLKRKREQEPVVSGRGSISPTASTRDKSPKKAYHESRKNPTFTKNTLSFDEAFPYSKGRVLLTSQPSRPSDWRSKGETQCSISFPDLIAPTHLDAPLKSVFLSTFTADFDWLLPHFDTRNVSFVLALNSATPQHRELLKRDFSDIPNVKLILPPVGPGSGNGVSCMHSKIILLFYEATNQNRSDILGTSRCRIIIPSANLVPFDYGVGGFMENVVFLMDLPPVSISGTTGANPFKSNLVEQLSALDTPDSVIRKLDGFDFGETAGLGFVHSIGGSHFFANNNREPNMVKQQKQISIRNFMPASGTASTAASAHNAAPESTPGSKPSVSRPFNARTGLLSLSDTITNLGLAVSPHDDTYPITLDYVTSSLGNLNQAFLQNLYLAACGNALEYPLPGALGSKSRLKAHQHIDSVDATSPPNYEHIQKHLRIYFPSEKTVRSSKGGPTCAGTICFQSKWWESDQRVSKTTETNTIGTKPSTDTSFPKECLRDCIGARKDGMLMHSKILYARYNNPISVRQTDGSTLQYAGWVYVGSANLTESAWGKISTDAKLKQAKITCRNWESGVVIPVPLTKATSGSDQQARTNEEVPNINLMSLEEVFGYLVPVPIVYPSATITELGNKPWFFTG